jgi:hypothetical protein
MRARLRYGESPEPPLPDPQQNWATERVRAWSERVRGAYHVFDFDECIQSTTGIQKSKMPEVDFTDFQPALFAATVMNSFEQTWCIAGGWAIDLWLGRATRDHKDVEVAVLREDQIALRDFLREWKFNLVTKGHLKTLRRDDRQMVMLPIHQLHAADARGRKLEFLLNESDSVDWLYRRDARIRWPLDQWIVRGGFGVPVIAPHIALLYKSKSPRPQDELDLRSSLPKLDSELREWLAQAIRLSDPKHGWIPGLSEAQSSQ